MCDNFPVGTSSIRGKDEHKLEFTFEKDEHIDLYLLKLNSAIKLLELVKERIKMWRDNPDFGHDYSLQHIEEYQSLVGLVEASEK